MNRTLARLIAMVAALVLLACGILPTPTTTPEPLRQAQDTATATWTPEPTPTPVVIVVTATPEPMPTAAPTPAMILPPYCILPPVFAEVEAIVKKEYPGAEVPRDGALLFAVRFWADGGQYMAMLGYNYDEGAWDLLYIMPWNGEITPTPTPTPEATPGTGREARIEKLSWQR